MAKKVWPLSIMEILKDGSLLTMSCGWHRRLSSSSFLLTVGVECIIPISQMDRQRGKEGRNKKNRTWQRKICSLVTHVTSRGWISQAEVAPGISWLGSQLLPLLASPDNRQSYPTRPSVQLQSFFHVDDLRRGNESLTAIWQHWAYANLPSFTVIGWQRLPPCLGWDSLRISHSIPWIFNYCKPNLKPIIAGVIPLWFFLFPDFRTVFCWFFVLTVRSPNLSRSLRLGTLSMIMTITNRISLFCLLSSISSSPTVDPAKTVPSG